MRRSFLIALTVAALAAGPSFAQDPHAAHHPAAPETKPAADAAPTHEMCKAVMGKQMDPKAVHEHSREKSGIAMWPNGKPLTKAEMEKMHKACAEKMAQPAK
jgi:hypothetical protein